MEHQPEAATVPPSRWEPLREALVEQRLRVGSPSYAEIAERIARARRAAGLSSDAARVARTTVYDVFRPGRVRMNVEFAREIAAAIEATPEQFEAWVDACFRRAEEPAEQASVGGEVVGIQAPAPAEPVTTGPEARYVFAVVVGSVVLNMIGRVVVDTLHLSIYLDMVGTAVAALTLGPWRGAAVGAATNILAITTSGWVSLPFAIVNVVGALVWGYGVRWGAGRTLLRFFCLNLLVAISCSLVAVPILVLLFGGSVGQGQDTITATFLELGQGLVAAVGFSNLLTSTLDKLLSGFFALVVISALPMALRARTHLLPGLLRPEIPSLP